MPRVWRAAGNKERGTAVRVQPSDAGRIRVRRVAFGRIRSDGAHLGELHDHAVPVLRLWRTAFGAVSTGTWYRAAELPSARWV